jgi:DNA-binding CsgD family transcriptional regulator
MSVVESERPRDAIVRLSHRGLGVREFSLAAARALRCSIPFDGVCVVTLDPATLLPTGHVTENALPESAMARYAEIEIRERDVNKFADLARAGARAKSLSAATGGHLERSARHRELRAPNGFGDELRAAFVGDAGAWGAIVLLRADRSADFTECEASLLASLSESLAEGLRRAMLLTALAGSEPEDEAPGLVLLAEDGSTELANPAAQAWLDELGADPAPGALLPLAIRTVALRARDAAKGRDGAARARVRTPSGRWLLVRGSMLRDAAAVILEPARAPELAPLIADAYGFTPRERAVTELVAQGYSTNEIAGRLFISPYTVQDHLKLIFEKTGVSTRGELVARLFFEHYAPRLADAA